MPKQTRNGIVQKKYKYCVLFLCIIIVLIGIIGGTSSYLIQMTAPVVNEFQIGDITYELKLCFNPPKGYTNADVDVPNVTPDDDELQNGAQDTIAAGSVDFNLDKAPTIEGYTFEGWYADEMLKEKLYNESTVSWLETEFCFVLFCF